MEAFKYADTLLYKHYIKYYENDPVLSKIIFDHKNVRESNYLRILLL